MSGKMDPSEPIRFGPCIEQCDADALFEVAAGRPPGGDAGERLASHGLALEYDARFVPAGMLLTTEGWKVLKIWRANGGES